MLSDEQREALRRCPDCGHDWSGHNDSALLAGWIKCRGQRGLGSVSGCKCELTLVATVERIASDAARAAERALVERIGKLADELDAQAKSSGIEQRLIAEKGVDAETAAYWEGNRDAHHEDARQVRTALRPEAATTKGARPPLDWSDSETWPPELSALLEREHGVGYRAGIEAEKQQRRDEAADAADLATVCAHCGAAIYDGSACKPDLCYLAARPSSTPGTDDAAAVHPDTEGEHEWYEAGDGHGYVYQYIGPIHYLCECGDYFLNRVRWLAHKDAARAARGEGETT